MKTIFKYFLVSVGVILFGSCNSDNSSEETVKYIKTYSLSYPSGTQKNEIWNYNNKKQVVEIVRSNNTKTNYDYDNKGKLIKAYTYEVSDPANIKELYEFEYEEHLIRIITIKKDYFNNETSSVDEYVLDSTNRPIKRRYYSNGGTEVIYTYADGNLVQTENSSKYTVTYKYDNKKNLLYHYPIGFRLIMSDGLNLISNNNVINQKSSYEVPLSLSYDSDGYLVQIYNQEFTQKFTY